MPFGKNQYIKSLEHRVAGGARDVRAQYGSLEGGKLANDESRAVDGPA